MADNEIGPLAVLNKVPGLRQLLMLVGLALSITLGVMAAFWANEYGNARIFGTTFGHSNETFDDPVFIDVVTRGMLWAADKITEDGKPKPGYEPKPARKRKPAKKKK